MKLLTLLILLPLVPVVCVANANGGLAGRRHWATVALGAGRQRKISQSFGRL